MTTPDLGESPPPYRTSPWYDPREVHQPCQCPRCRAGARPRRWRPGWRLALALLAGVVLPVASLLVNAALHVVELGTLGTAALLASVASVLGHLLLFPARWSDAQLKPLPCPPDGTLTRLVLLGGALLGCVSWGYLALLFLPLLPLSLIGIIFAGVGLCGLCPFFALPLAIVHARRGFGAVRERLGLRWTLALAAALTLAAPATVGGALVVARARQAADQALLDAVAREPEGSAGRMHAIVALRGRERRLVDLFVANADAQRGALIAETYHRLTDATINAEVDGRRQALAATQRAAIRPFGPLDGLPLLGSNLFALGRW